MDSSDVQFFKKLRKNVHFLLFCNNRKLNIIMGIWKKLMILIKYETPTISIFGINYAVHKDQLYFKRG